MADSKINLLGSFLSFGIFSFFILFHFHHHGWLWSDDGYFAHIAQRLLQGEVLDKDIAQHHGDYLHLINAFCFSVFGQRIVTLRYPLLFLNFFTALLVFWHSRHSQLKSWGMGLAVTCASFILLPQPSPNWYGYFTAVILGLILANTAKTHKLFFMTGLSIGIIFNIRQLTAFYLTAGFWLCILLQTNNSTQVPAGKSVLSRCWLLVLFALLVFLSTIMTDSISVILFTFWPAAIFFTLCYRCKNYPDSIFIKSFFIFVLGAFFSFIPILLYHVYHGSLYSWLINTWYYPFFALSGRAVPLKLFYFISPLFSLVDFKNPQGIISFIYWTSNITLPFIHGYQIWNKLARQPIDSALAKRGSLSILLLMMATTPAYHPSLYYLAYSFGLILLSMLWMEDVKKPFRVGTWLFVFFLSAAAVYFVAGQPLYRPMAEIANGKKVGMIKTPPKLNLGLRLPAVEIEYLKETGRIINAYTQPNDPILGLLHEAHLYFVYQRKNLTPYAFPRIYLSSEEQRSKLTRHIEEQHFRLIVLDNYFFEYPSPFIQDMLQIIDKFYTKTPETTALQNNQYKLSFYTPKNQ